VIARIAIADVDGDGSGPQVRSYRGRSGVCFPATFLDGGGVGIEHRTFVAFSCEALDQVGPHLPHSNHLKVHSGPPVMATLGNYP
jgi:hypothetical protein